jgi:hypothetical protein
MDNLPAYVGIVFALTAFLTIWIFYKATRRSIMTLILLFVWLILQGFVSLTGFYTNTSGMPPRFILLVLPPLLVIAILFATSPGRKFIDGLNPGMLTLLQVVRIPVELVLLVLSWNLVVPTLMTFEGRNFDIFAGLTAPFVFYFGYIRKRKKLNKKIILLWNFLCLGLLFNIVINAVLSAPFPFQRFAFTQPNIAILYFPFIWLPCCIVPLVFFAHLACIRRILRHPSPGR